MPTFLAIKAGNVVDTVSLPQPRLGPQRRADPSFPTCRTPQLKGADTQGLTQLVVRHAGPNPPVAPLPDKAEEAKAKGNEAFRLGDWATAIDWYSKAIEEAVSLPLSLLRSTSPDFRC